MYHDVFEPSRKTGAEAITESGGRTVGTLLEFWQWAYSDLISNTERGALAEFLVACALGVQSGVRVSWDKYDLISPEGITVEVKSSGYLQSWFQEKPSSISFGIQETYGWDKNTNQYDSEKKRQADVYVFCVYKHTEPCNSNPLDLGQWDFYVLATKVLDQQLGKQERISLNALQEHGAVKCSYEELHRQIVVQHRLEAGCLPKETQRS